MSAPPASAKSTIATARLGAEPNAVMATPQPAAAQTTAIPCRCTPAVQPLVAVATSDPIEGAAYSSPSAPAPPNSSEKAGSSASGIPKNIAIRSMP
jgi:hypothetical protein